jgi:hypothetical protein
MANAEQSTRSAAIHAAAEHLAVRAIGEHCEPARDDVVIPALLLARLASPPSTGPCSAFTPGSTC